MLRTFALLLLCVAPAEARLLRLEVLSTTPAFAGRAFGAVGAYELVTARATVALDPADRHNWLVADIEHAPRNAGGLVEATSDVAILRPADPSRGNGVLLFDVPNRGRKALLPALNDAPATQSLTTAAEAGNGYVFRAGYTVVWAAWQHDVRPAPDVLVFTAPTLPGLTGPSREEWVWDNTENPVTAPLGYPVADPASLRLTVRAQEADRRQTPAGLRFELDGQAIRITRPDGFDAGAIYELTYQARDPVLGGMGFAAVRDVVAHLRWAADTPLSRGGSPEVSNAYAFGASQSGRFLRDFLHQGFNDDKQGRQVFDGMMPFIAGARRSFTNARFSMPGRSPRQHEDHLYPGDGFPFTYGVTTDALTGVTDGLMAWCSVAQTCPRIMHVDSDSEAWQGRAALITTGTDGRALELPTHVRAYMLAGIPHNTSPGWVVGPQPTCTTQSNPLHPGPALRALLAALDEWVRDDVPPPGSRYPTLAHGTLVPPGPGAVPPIPGLPADPLVNRVAVVNRDRMPPEPGKEYPMFVPRTDADGHALDAIRLPAIEAPRATYTGWSTRRAGFAEGALCGLAGATVPLPAVPTPEDPRVALSVRYPEAGSYVRAVQRAAERLMVERLLLREDADAAVAAARAGTLAGFPP